MTSGIAAYRSNNAKRETHKERNGGCMKISECLCAASLDSGLMHLEDGTCINLAHLYAVLAELREYAAQSTLEGDDTPDCVFEADKLLAQFS